MNESKIFYVLVRNATIINGRGMPPFTGDIGLVANRRVQVTDGRRELQTSLDHRRSGRSANDGCAADDRRDRA